jgi:transposase
MMDILHPHVCGIDVHAKFAVACCRHIGSTGTVTKTSRTVGTMTDDLQALAAWLRAAGVTHVAIESTGVLWQPVWNILEEHVTVVLVNPRSCCNTGCCATVSSRRRRFASCAI